MKNRIISLFFAFGLVSGCYAPKQTTENPKPDGKKSYEAFAAIIKTYPYEAPQPRKDRVIKNYSKLEIGMPKDQVAGLIGEPDYSRPSYGAKRPTDMRWPGSSWTYYLYKRSDLVNTLDACVQIFFGTDDHVKWIVPSNIEGLVEKGSPAHNGA